MKLNFSQRILISNFVRDIQEVWDLEGFKYNALKGTVSICQMFKSDLELGLEDLTYYLGSQGLGFQSKGVCHKGLEDVTKKVMRVLVTLIELVDYFRTRTLQLKYVLPNYCMSSSGSNIVSRVKFTDTYFLSSNYEEVLFKDIISVTGASHPYKDTSLKVEYYGKNYEVLTTQFELGTVTSVVNLHWMFVVMKAYTNFREVYKSTVVFTLQRLEEAVPEFDIKSVEDLKKVREYLKGLKSLR